MPGTPEFQRGLEAVEETTAQHRFQCRSELAIHRPRSLVTLVMESSRHRNATNDRTEIRNSGPHGIVCHRQN